MCMFSKPVEIVTNTKIFARMDKDRQVLIYEMELTANNETATTTEEIDLRRL